MIIRFGGFKNPPFRSHITLAINGRYRKINIGDVVEEEPKTCFELMSNKDLLWTQVRQQRAQTEAAPAGDNRAILDGKAE